MDHLCRADGGQIPVSLVGKDDPVRQHALDAGRHGRRAPVRGLAEVTVKIVVRQHRAPDGGDADRTLADAQFVHHLGDDPVGDAPCVQPGQ